MLVIRKEQMKVFSAAGIERFVNRMVQHHQEFFPEWSRNLGTNELEAFVRYGIERAQLYGFQVELDLARYLHVMQALGKRFDESPDYPWAANLLSQKLPAQDKMDRLLDAAQYEMEARRIQGAH
jgi:hypothetical protein